MLEQTNHDDLARSSNDKDEAEPLSSVPTNAEPEPEGPMSPVQQPKGSTSADDDELQVISIAAIGTTAPRQQLPEMKLSRKQRVQKETKRLQSMTQIILGRWEARQEELEGRAAAKEASDAWGELSGRKKKVQLL